MPVGAGIARCKKIKKGVEEKRAKVDAFASGRGGAASVTKKRTSLSEVQDE
jgi:hypothetical protein